MAEALRFERETCSRCGGSGEYSYCEMYGHTCFKCQGKREVLTKRAKVAAQWMNEQNLIAAKDVKPGMRIKGMGLILNVVSIKRASHGSKSLQDGVWIEYPPGWEIKGEKYAMIVPLDWAELQLIRSKPEQVELLKQAIDYQNSLTKEGKPRKKVAA